MNGQPVTPGLVETVDRVELELLELELVEVELLELVVLLELELVDVVVDVVVVAATPWVTPAVGRSGWNIQLN